MVFGDFGQPGHAFANGLGDSTDQLQINRMRTSQDGLFAAGPVSTHSAFVSSSVGGVSSFREEAARLKMEQQQRFLSQQPVTPLRDTPHTPTNLNDFHSTLPPTTSTSTMAHLQGHPNAAFSGPISQIPMSQNHLDSNHGNEVEATELREFIAPGSNDTDPTLDHAKEVLQALQQQVDEIRASQTSILTSLCQNLVSESSDNAPHFAAMEQCLTIQAEHRHTCVTSLQSIIEVRQTRVLSSAEAERSSVLGDDLAFTLANLDILTTEMNYYLAWIREGAAMPTLSQLTAIVIARAPFPSIWMKRNQMNDAESVYVKLIHGCSVTLSSVSEVRAAILSHTSYAAKTAPAKPIIDNDIFAMDPSTLVASCGFVYTGGSRKDVAQCRFTMTAQGSCFATSVLVNRGVENVVTQEVAVLTTENSKPFIVITNECQYGETFGILFHKDAFEYQWMTAGAAEMATVTDANGITTLENGTLAEIPWPLFANSIQRYFIRASKQDPVQPKRGLSVFDLEHIHSHFFNSLPTVDYKSFQRFWDWYGKVLHRLRYQRHVAAMWTEGLIFGMVGREGVCEQLVSRPPGTFLLRFSESSAGFIAVGYRVSGANAGIKNYLVKQEDTASATVKTLPDFIRSRPEFSVILQYTGQHLEDGFPVLYPIHKDFALKAYCAARPPKIVDPKAGSPYDEL